MATVPSGDGLEQLSDIFDNSANGQNPSTQKRLEVLDGRMFPMVIKLLGDSFGVCKDYTVKGNSAVEPKHEAGMLISKSDGGGTNTVE